METAYESGAFNAAVSAIKELNQLGDAIVAAELAWLGSLRRSAASAQSLLADSAKYVGPE